MNDYSDGPVWEAFGLTRASYAVFPRRALQSMPRDWQAKFVALVGEMHDTLLTDIDADYTVQRREGGRFVTDWLKEYRHTGPLPRKKA